jgi:hypothetical protein
MPQYVGRAIRESCIRKRLIKSVLYLPVRQYLAMQMKNKIASRMLGNLAQNFANLFK